MKKKEKGVYTKAQKEKVCKAILKDVEGRVPECTVDFLVGEVLCNHPRWKEKIGCGLDHIEVRNALYGAKGFYIVRTDGTSTDISYRKSIYSSINKREEIMKACRTVVSPIIEMHRNQVRLPFVCPITGEVVTDKSEVHIDHYDLTFKELFDLWMTGKDEDDLYDRLSVSKTDGCVEVHFDDPILTMDFYQFHNTHTHLRAVSKTANLSVLNRK